MELCPGTIYMLWNFVLGLYAMELCPGTIYMLWNFVLGLYICYGTSFLYLFIVAYICYGTMLSCYGSVLLWFYTVY